MKKQQAAFQVVSLGIQNYDFIPMGKDNFNIEILVIDIPSVLKESLLNAQKRQYR